VVIALGVTWVLDGLEVTLVGAVAGALVRPDTLALTEQQVGGAATAYLAGAIVGALVFGRLTDLVGRKRLFLVTLSVYLVATLLTAASTGFVTFALFRALTGAGIGGEYAAINSAIDELLPARSADAPISPSTAPTGSARPWAPSPPWSCSIRTCCHPGSDGGCASPSAPCSESRSSSCDGTSRRARGGSCSTGGATRPRGCCGTSRRRSPASTALSPRRAARCASRPTPDWTNRTIARILFRRHRRRAVLGLSLMVAQAFAYNAVFFTYGLVLGKFYGVPADRIGLYLLPFALGNLLGPFLLGHLFDTVGRRRMIVFTYGIAGLLLLATGWAFALGWLGAESQTVLWCRCSSSPRPRRAPPTSPSPSSSRWRCAGWPSRCSTRWAPRRGAPRPSALRRAHRLGSRCRSRSEMRSARC
jgi:hypothetical protein